jgi:hypothetical protein
MWMMWKSFPTAIWWFLMSIATVTDPLNGGPSGVDLKIARAGNYTAKTRYI